MNKFESFNLPVVKDKVKKKMFTWHYNIRCSVKKKNQLGVSARYVSIFYLFKNGKILVLVVTVNAQNPCIVFELRLLRTSEVSSH